MEGKIEEKQWKGECEGGGKGVVVEEEGEGE